MAHTDFSKEFIHPADDAARKQLEAIPGFTTVMKAFMKLVPEQLFHGLNMANKIHLSEKQLPGLYHRLLPVCDTLGIEQPGFYLEMNPFPNAYTYGDSRTFLTITSGLIDHLQTEELDAVIAHECGHIVCRHVLYHTMAYILLNGAKLLGLAGKLIAPIQLGLFYWQRRSELSADRAAAVVAGSARPVVGTMIRLSGGPVSLTGSVDIDEYASQADEYEDLLDSTWDKILQSIAISQQSHPFPAIRVREIRNWAKSDNFTRMLEEIEKRKNEKHCPSCDKMTQADWKFCEHCGCNLSETNEATAD